MPKTEAMGLEFEFFAGGQEEKYASRQENSDETQRTMSVIGRQALL